jgi:hypothetical protein
LVKKWFKIQFEGYREPMFKTFILFAWIIIWFAWESIADATILFNSFTHI